MSLKSIEPLSALSTYQQDYCRTSSLLRYCMIWRYITYLRIRKTVIGLQGAYYGKNTRQLHQVVQACASDCYQSYPLSLSLGIWLETTYQYHHVPSSICFHLFRKLWDNICDCFEGIQKADWGSYCRSESSHSHRVALLRLFQCHHHYPSDSNTERWSISRCWRLGKVDKVAGFHCQCLVCILCNPPSRQSRWCGKLRHLKPFTIYHLTRLTLAWGIPTRDCNIHRIWSLTAGKHLLWPDGCFGNW